MGLQESCVFIDESGFIPYQINCANNTSSFILLLICMLPEYNV